MDASVMPMPSVESFTPDFALDVDRARAASIVARHGRQPLDYFKLWPDKSYHFSRSGAGVIAYATAWSVAVSLGDPVGPVEELADLVTSFSRFCAAHGWLAAFHQVPSDLLPVYRAQGLDMLKAGEEAIVDLDRFRARTSRQRCFRRAKNHLEEAGYRLMRRSGPHPGALLDEVEAVSREWLSLPGRRERNFALGRFDRAYLTHQPLVLVRDPRGRLVAFLNEVPGIRAGLATVDLMRHRRDAPNGLMDYLFGETMLRLHAEGYRWFSLGLAPLAGVGEARHAAWPERVAHEIYQHASRVFSFKGLRSYKAKFDPIWEDRFLVYEGSRLGLLRIVLALASLTRSLG